MSRGVKVNVRGKKTKRSEVEKRVEDRLKRKEDLFNKVKKNTGMAKGNEVKVTESKEETKTHANVDYKEMYRKLKKENQKLEKQVEKLSKELAKKETPSDLLQQRYERLKERYAKKIEVEKKTKETLTEKNKVIKELKLENKNNECLVKQLNKEIKLLTDRLNTQLDINNNKPKDYIRNNKALNKKVMNLVKELNVMRVERDELRSKIKNILKGRYINLYPHITPSLIFSLINSMTLENHKNYRASIRLSDTYLNYVKLDKERIERERESRIVSQQIKGTSIDLNKEYDNEIYNLPFCEKEIMLGVIAPNFLNMLAFQELGTGNSYLIDSSISPLMYFSHGDLVTAKKVTDKDFVCVIRKIEDEEIDNNNLFKFTETSLVTTTPKRFTVKIGDISNSEDGNENLSTMPNMEWKEPRTIKLEGKKIKQKSPNQKIKLSEDCPKLNILIVSEPRVGNKYVRQLTKLGISAKTIDAFEKNPNHVKNMISHNDIVIVCTDSVPHLVNEIIGNQDELKFHYIPKDDFAKVFNRIRIAYYRLTGIPMKLVSDSNKILI